MNGCPSQPQSWLPNPEGRACAEETKRSPSTQGHCSSALAKATSWDHGPSGGSSARLCRKNCTSRYLRWSPWFLNVEDSFNFSKYSACQRRQFDPRVTGVWFRHTEKEMGFLSMFPSHGASQVALVVKNLPANVGDAKDTGSIPGLGRSLGRGHGYSL